MIALGAVTIWLSGCGSTVSSVDTAHVCPPTVDYSTATQDRAALDLRLLPQDSPLISMMGDYSLLRDQVRVCR